MIRAAALAVIIAAPANASGYSDHTITNAFRDLPCAETIGAIDKPDMSAAIASGDPKAVTGPLGKQAGYFGFIVGFDVASGGLNGDAETTLARLREACAENPQASALDLLHGF